MYRVTAFAALVSGELVKIFHRKKYPFLLAALGAVIIAGIGLALIPGNRFNINLVYYPFTVLKILMYCFIPLAVSLLAADLLTGEFVSGEIRRTLACPVSRRMVLFAKLAAVLLYAAIMYLGSFFLASILSICFSGIASVSFAAVLQAYTLDFLFAIVMASMAGVIGSLAKSRISCFIFCLAAHFGITALVSLTAGLIVMTVCTGCFIIAGGRIFSRREV
ncbi:ABC transporter permease [Breznakiella homolactica]|uniref:ABC transporter permease n=1 Tax=Breznakiella homolactica TaxID=2798577 RepID=A0A7T7XP23_9SPIR|nr:ABC transporter permease [Breznakiella homolactica]QQO09863.1 ABC transporter permease [Breznakiella homolactica]